MSTKTGARTNRSRLTRTIVSWSGITESGRPDAATNMRATFSVRSIVSSKNLLFIFFYNYFKEAPTECVEDTPCQASLTECVDFGNCVNPNGVLDVLDESGTPGTNGHSLQVECAASNPGAYPANNGNKFGDISCVCDGKNECKWMASEVFSGTPFQVTDVTEDNLCVTDHTCPVT